MSGSLPLGCLVSVFMSWQNLNLSGSSLLSSNIYTFTGSGFINLYGEAPYTTSSGIIITTHFKGSGNVQLSGTAAVSSSNKGEFVENSTVDFVLENFMIFYKEKQGLSLLTGTTQTTIDWCDCKLIPNRFGLQTNLNRQSAFTEFIKYNNYNFNTILNMFLNQNDIMYSSNYQFGEITKDGSSTKLKEWYLSSFLTCDSSLENFDGVSMWILNINFTLQEKINSIIDNNQQTNIRIWIPATVLCPTRFGSSMSFSISVNTKTKKGISENGTVLPNVFINDNIGIFNSQAWTNNPILNISFTNFVSS
jgi:hypothetical protein